jgi:hypothetical protein
VAKLKVVNYQRLMLFNSQRFPKQMLLVHRQSQLYLLVKLK